ncbi:MAG TPA: tRNA (adenosine(37)-N6)-threonylcarbamoyltransferase complex dimerization subunit type 1 TsaB [Steroidobacteraceae bacterium]|nr:tRNA (adenosine(37)-N6)-threonylcarbamoyltransferase complex dimerization subunit type 1 TsaB [Steroidobacteraceae bacterium]
MTLLAIDTATEACSAALLRSGELLERYIELDRGHAERILEMVDELLAEGGVVLRDLDAIAFGRGPGAFTGVRLAAAVTQGLAYGAGLPVLPVSDLRAVAQQVFDLAPTATAALVCTDARMKEVYWGCFERGADGLAVASSEERVGSPDTVSIPAKSGREVHGAGRGFQAYPALGQRLGGRLASVHPTLLPRAGAIARLGEADRHAGRALPAEQALPVYLRDDVVQFPSRH